MKKPNISEFELLGELVKRSRRAFWLNIILGSITLVALMVAALVILKPVPVVVRSDDPEAPALVVRSGDTEVREVDAKRFFVTMGERLHGWNSASVVEDLSSAALLMTSSWRVKFKKELISLVDVPSDFNTSGKTTLIGSYTRARVRNDFRFKWSTVKCGKTDGIWYCRGRATIETQPLIGQPVNDPKLKRKVAIRAAFKPVPTTLETLDGLLVDFWDAQKVEEE